MIDMESNKLPKVLSISLSTWKKDSGIHTQTDLFEFWDKEQLAQIYVKSDLPNTPVCDKFFQISENAVIKSVINRQMVGREVQNTDEPDEHTRSAIEQEKKLYARARKKHSWLISLLRELVWALGRWKSQALNDFVEGVDPDIYFVPIYPVVYMGWIQLYILKRYPRPYVCYLADDNYSYISCGNNPLAYVHRFLLRKVVKRLAINCAEMFVITEKEAKETDKDFGTNSVVLTKGIDYSMLTYEEKEVSTPIHMVYTGKLVIGRASSLAAISKAMENINKDKMRMVLDIYSPDIVDEKTMCLLNSNGCRHHGAVSKEDVETIQKSADVVVFVESLEDKFKYAARLSFSTKLTDYFKSGKCIFAIGDKSIAPIEYLEKNDAAVIATEYNQIETKLQMLIDNKKKIQEYGYKAFACGKRNHNKELIKDRFISTLLKAATQDARKCE